MGRQTSTNIAKPSECLQDHAHVDQEEGHEADEPTDDALLPLSVPKLKRAKPALMIDTSAAVIAVSRFRER